MHFGKGTKTMKKFNLDHYSSREERNNVYQDILIDTMNIELGIALEIKFEDQLKAQEQDL